ATLPALRGPPPGLPFLAGLFGPLQAGVEQVAGEGAALPLGRLLQQGVLVFLRADVDRHPTGPSGHGPQSSGAPPTTAQSVTLWVHYVSIIGLEWSTLGAQGGPPT